jgi:hypothetical protein
MDTHFNAGGGFQAAGAFHHPYPGSAQASGQASGSSMITPTILGQGSSASLLNSIDGASTSGSLGTGSSGASGSSLVNALQGLAQMLLGGGGSGGSAGSGFTLSLPQYQPMQKPSEHDTRDIAPSPAGSGGASDE